MYKKLGAVLLVLFFIILFQNRSFAAFWHRKKAPATVVKEHVFVPVNNVDENRIWVGTFQLVWNAFQNDVIKAPVVFTGKKSELAESLNKQGFDSSKLSDDSYYVKQGRINFKLKKEIEDALMKKFDETSEVLDNVNWNSDGILVYAMLKKDFKFLKAFTELRDGDFEGETVKFYGVTRNGSEKLRENVGVLFYNSADNFAVKLNTKNGEEVILYRTDDDKTLEEYYLDLISKQTKYKGEKTFKTGDSLKVPYINFDENFKYDELTNRPIIGTDYIIDGAIQTVKFKMDNKGGTLKSEAALTMKMSMAPIEPGRSFTFNKPFVLFLREKDKDSPYFITHFKNAALFEKPVGE